MSDTISLRFTLRKEGMPPKAADTFTHSIAVDGGAATIESMIVSVLAEIPRHVTTWITIRWDGSIDVSVTLSEKRGRQSTDRWVVRRPGSEESVVWMPANRVRLLIAELVRHRTANSVATVTEVRNGLIVVS